ncbi:hypothetical protein [Natronococcus wangiae]|uniref:hypothetical protein n=1 Tax=Natronococcus wangiae TaxID=3068275 RepID=UPI00273EAAD2|nr:hypothetical protein [Natronococcus sp. AD5]
MTDEKERRNQVSRGKRENADGGDQKKGDASGPSRECHRRGCDKPPRFVVLERYQEETGHGAVEAEAALCREHTAEESPANLEDAYEDYVFRVEPIPDADGGDDANAA